MELTQPIHAITATKFITSVVILLSVRYADEKMNRKDITAHNNWKK